MSPETEVTMAGSDAFLLRSFVEAAVDTTACAAVLTCIFEVEAEGAIGLAN